MDALRVISFVLAAAWLLAGAVSARSRLHRTATLCLVVAAAQALAGIWPALAPLVLAAWLAYALAIPDGRLGTAQRRALVAVGAAGVASWAIALAVGHDRPAGAAYAWSAVAVVVTALAGAALRCRRAGPSDRRVIQLLTAAAVLAAAFGVVCAALHVLAGAPDSLWVWLVAALVLVPVGQVLAAVIDDARVAAAALVESIVVAGLAGLVVVVYLVVVVGLGRRPTGHERDVLLASLAAAVVVAVLALPVRHRLVTFAVGLVGGREPSAEQVVTTFGARMSRAVPMDELMLQLAESLRASLAGGGAEIWVGADGLLNRTVSVPTLLAAQLRLGEQERVVVGRARIGGLSWASVWLPDLIDPGSESNGARRDLRVAPVAHLGELLGLIVVRRGSDAAAFTDEDERLLVELARQLGLALHNVRLDSALQASLAEIEQRNAELQASRLRIVAASDAARRAIERNLHDGAQQHLVALAVKLGLARQIVEDGEPDCVPVLLDDLRADVQETIAELRELAHGIYPPLLRDRGLGEALRTAAARSPLACSVDVGLPGRYPEEAETAAYFCCLEALQNAGKYAGARAAVTVRVSGDESALWFEVADDGVGFDPCAGASGHGFLNMRDRLGALGGQLSVDSTPGHGARVSARIPAQPLRPADRDELAAS